LALNFRQISTAGFRLRQKRWIRDATNLVKFLRRWTLHEAVGKAKDAQFGRLWLTAKMSPFGPCLREKCRRQYVCFQGMNRIGGATEMGAKRP
jgi:hypothetical protein